MSGTSVWHQTDQSECQATISAPLSIPLSHFAEFSTRRLSPRLRAADMQTTSEAPIKLLLPLLQGLSLAALPFSIKRASIALLHIMRQLKDMQCTGWFEWFDSSRVYTMYVPPMIELVLICPLAPHCYAPPHIKGPSFISPPTAISYVILHSPNVIS